MGAPDDRCGSELMAKEKFAPAQSTGESSGENSLTDLGSAGKDDHAFGWDQVRDEPVRLGLLVGVGFTGSGEDAGHAL